MKGEDILADLRRLMELFPPLPVVPVLKESEYVNRGMTYRLAATEYSDGKPIVLIHPEDLKKLRGEGYTEREIVEVIEELFRREERKRAGGLERSIVEVPIDSQE